MNNDVNFGDQPGYNADKGYAMSGKIMLSAIVILLFVVILMVCLHLYARWYLLRARRRHQRRNRHRRTHFVFFVDPSNPNPIYTTNSRGLDESVLKSLPVFVYSSKTHTEPMDCAVCLSEFEENESGRVLPKCNHTFHIDCIDMWFHSHATCPLCRSPVELVTEESEKSIQVVIPVSDPGSSSDMCDACRQECREGFGNDSTGFDTTASQTQTQSSLRSPVGRMLSFKRILSREKRGTSTPSGNLSTCGTNEVDVERGMEEIRQTEC